MKKVDKKMKKMAMILMMLGVSFGFALFGAQSATAATITVNTGSDHSLSNDGLCSLREAINSANNDSASIPGCVTGSGTDTIIFSGVPLIELLTSLPTLSHDVNIQGPTRLVMRSSGGYFLTSVFTINATVNISNLTFTNFANSSDLFAAVINNICSLTITNSTLSGNKGGKAVPSPTTER